MLTLSPEQKQAITQLAQTSDRPEEISPGPLITFEELSGYLPPVLHSLVTDILALKPQDVGTNNKFLGIEAVPLDMVEVKGQSYLWGNEQIELKSQFVPGLVYRSYRQMTQAFQTDHPERRLMIESGYRSPAYQILVYLAWLGRYEFDVLKTSKQVALPAYSQHCSATRTALDLINLEGSPTAEAPQKFGDTLEYAWLKNNASEYGFTESYPQDNAEGIMWEPWHWQYVGK